MRSITFIHSERIDRERGPKEKELKGWSERGAKYTLTYILYEHAKTLYSGQYFII